MDLPTIPAPVPLRAISASFCNAATACKARAAWLLIGQRGAIPGTTGAILGTAFHEVMRLANSGQIPGIEEAKVAFDHAAEEIFEKAHPLLKAKFSLPGRMPFYHQRRSSAAALASKSYSRDTVAQQSDGAQSALSILTPTNRSKYVEQKFTSKDGLVTGAIDLLDGHKITDYKSGFAPPNGAPAITETESQQLRLYVHLAHEKGIPVDEAEIVRADGARAIMKVTAEEATEEGQRARALLEDFNSRISQGASFESLATPSPSACSNCSCIPFCEAFWSAANSDWEDECGTHAEGVVTDIRMGQMMNASLVSLTIDAVSGTVPAGNLTVEQIPREWLEIVTPAPVVGSRIRVVQASRQKNESAPDPRVLRADRLKSTSIWNT